MAIRHAVLLALVLALLPGCSSVRKVLGFPEQNDPSELKSAEARWLLVQNPRYGDVVSEPEYIWVEEDKVPTTFKTLMRGTSSIIAPPEIVAKYGPPPGGGKISPRQKVPYQTVAPPTGTPAAGAPPSPGAMAPPRPAAVGPVAGVAPAAEFPRRGYVVHVDTTRIAIDLTSADGLRPGTIVSLRRDKMPIVHPVTGEVLGELDEEVGTAKVVELRERFSVAEIESVQPGSQIQVRDRVVPK
jgi:hypothetical protein